MYDGRSIKMITGSSGLTSNLLLQL